MSAFSKYLRLSLLCALLACIYPAFGAPTHAADDRDRQVLDAALLHLLAAPDFAMIKGVTNGAVIVLHWRTPDKIGDVNPTIYPTNNRSLPRDAADNVIWRNTPVDPKPKTYFAVAVSYTNLTFSTPIVVADLTGKTYPYGIFEKTYPKAVAYVYAYLPGYSRDGTQAVVRARVGPSEHGAGVTVLLERIGEKWIVKWHELEFYV